MSNGKKRTIRDNFTDALNNELKTRKVFDRAKVNEPEEDIFLADTSPDDEIAPPIFAAEPKKTPTLIEKPKAEEKQPTLQIKPETPKKFSETPQKKEPAAKIEKPPAKLPNIQVKPETDFEERVFAEADSDFHDEKIPTSIGANIRSDLTEEIERRPIFHSKYFNKKPGSVPEEKPKKEAPEEPPEFDEELHHKLTHAETAGLALSAIMLMYSFINLDKPLFFVSLSLFSHLIRPLIGAFFGKYNRPVQNALRGFSLVLFAGAIMFIFFP